MDEMRWDGYGVVETSRGWGVFTSFVVVVVVVSIHEKRWKHLNK